MKMETRSQKSEIRMLIGVILVFAFCFLKAAESASVAYNKAATLYKANDFKNAALQYEKLLTQDYKTAEVYYNLGNCYYKLNNTGRAILNYERALRLSPNDEDVNHNLKIAEQQVIDKIQPVPQLGIVTWWNKIVFWQSASGWRMFAATSIWVSLLAFAGYLFTDIKRLAAVTGSLLLLLSVVFILLAFKQSSSEQYSNEAIVLVAAINVKSAPDSNGNDIFTVHEGLKLKVLDNVGQWYKVRLADGKTGWLESTSFSRI